MNGIIFDNYVRDKQMCSWWKHNSYINLNAVLKLFYNRNLRNVEQHKFLFMWFN
jgi:hypothetical protein